MSGDKASRDALFRTYSELADALSHVCDGQRWHITGASTVLRDRQGRLVFELTKPKHWRLRDDGATEVGIGGVGGTVERGEGILDALHRELLEELGCGARLASAEETHLVYEQRQVTSLGLPQGNVPRPAFFTVSANLYRRQELPEFPILAIATFWAVLDGEPMLDDIYGIVRVPVDQVATMFADETISLRQLESLPRVRVQTQQPIEPLHEGPVVLRPSWTGRSFQILLQRGLIEL